MAACYLDSLATYGYPGYGYGLHYDFGICTQRIENGQQVEQLKHWLRYGNPWEFEWPNAVYPVRGRRRFYSGKRKRPESQVTERDCIVSVFRSRVFHGSSQMHIV